VLQDAVLAVELLEAPHGIIIFDDYDVELGNEKFWQGVKPAVDAVLAIYGPEALEVVERKAGGSTQIVVRKKADSSADSTGGGITTGGGKQDVNAPRRPRRGGFPGAVVRERRLFCQTND
jgi:hypothetical protein